MQDDVSIPNELGATYDVILMRINTMSIPYVKLLLQRFVFGMRPLTSEELATVATFDSLSGNFDSNLVLLHPDDVIQLCLGLVSKAQDNTVQLVHASVKEYFLARPKMLQSNQISVFNTGTGHDLIAYCCVKYILQGGWHNDVTEYPLLRYACQFWPSHYSLSNKNPTLHDTVMEFFRDGHGLFMRSAKMNDDALWVHHHYGATLPLHYAVCFGLEDVIQNLIIHDQGFLKYCTGVHIAAVQGYTSIFKLLIDIVLDVDANGGKYDDAMQATFASVHGPTEIVNLLLEMGPRNVYEGKYGNALQAASLEGHIEIVKLLLGMGAEVNLAWRQMHYKLHHLNPTYKNTLEVASFSGYVKVTFGCTRVALVRRQPQDNLGLLSP